MENAEPVWNIDEVLFDANSYAFKHELARLKQLMESQCDPSFKLLYDEDEICTKKDELSRHP